MFWNQFGDFTDRIQSIRIHIPGSNNVVISNCLILKFLTLSSRTNHQYILQHAVTTHVSSKQLARAKVSDEHALKHANKYIYKIYLLSFSVNTNDYWIKMVVYEIQGCFKSQLNQPATHQFYFHPSIHNVVRTDYAYIQEVFIFRPLRSVNWICKWSVYIRISIS